MNNQRLGMLFDTSEDSHYFFDSGTGKVVNCNLEEKEFINKILNNEISLEKACSLNPEFKKFIADENLFAYPEQRTFVIPNKEEFIEDLKGNCEQLILELTESCNLRCGYCIYNEHHPSFRGFSNKKMSFEVAKKSIDFLLTDFKKERFALTFYGGEPLTNYELMKKCIDYTKAQYPNIILDISFTTNLTLLTQEMVDYFKTLDNLYILCSIDGPELIHNKYRRYVNGKGTFNDAIRGLKLLLSDFYGNGKNGNMIAINCVVAPPYSQKQLKEIKDFFYDDLKLPEDIKCNFSYLDRGNMQIDYNDDEMAAELTDADLKENPIEDYALNNFIETGDLHDFSVINKQVLSIVERTIKNDGVIDSSWIHGNCIPGKRRLYVSVDGNFKPCERIGQCPSLGDYQNGFNYDQIYKNYLVDYAKYYDGICKDCWAQSMCSLCYHDNMGKSGVKKDTTEFECRSSRDFIKSCFIMYYKLFEKVDRKVLKAALDKFEQSKEEAEGFRKYEV